jgi:hypothetical protein
VTALIRQGVMRGARLAQMRVEIDRFREAPTAGCAKAISFRIGHHNGLFDHPTRVRVLGDDPCDCVHLLLLQLATDRLEVLRVCRRQSHKPSFHDQGLVLPNGVRSKEFELVEKECSTTFHADFGVRQTKRGGGGAGTTRNGRV